MFCAIGAFTFTRSLFSVNGGWSSWYSWSSYGSCSKTCGYGTKKYKRWRYCNNPTPKNGGRGCYGSSAKYKYIQCHVRTCPIGMFSLSLLHFLFVFLTRSLILAVLISINNGSRFLLCIIRR